MSIEIAILDSGINPWHPHVQGVAGGISLHLGKGGQIVADEDFRDAIGHGTAIAGLIRETSTTCDLLAVKIFHRELNAPIALLLAGLKWAIDRRAKLIHLSLGTCKEGFRSDLESLCRKAFDQGSVIVAAARTPDDTVYPAALPGVIGVYWNRLCAPGELTHHPGMPVEFGAFGQPRVIPGLPPEQNFSGSSFAAARVSALVAGFLEAHPHADAQMIMDHLKKRC